MHRRLPATLAVVGVLLLLAGCQQLQNLPSLHIPGLAKSESTDTLIARSDEAAGKGDYEGAARSLQQALDHLGSSGNEQQRVVLLARLAQLDDSRGNFAEEYNHAAAAVELVRSHAGSAEKSAAAAYNAYSLASRRRADYAGALTAAEQANTAAAASSDLRGQAAALRNRGSVRYARSQFEPARKDFQESIDLAGKIPDGLEEAKTLNDLALLEARAGRYTEAMRAAERAATLREGTGDIVGQGRVLGDLCVIQIDLQDFPSAQQSCSKSYDIARRVGNRSLEANNLNNLAWIDVRAARLVDAMQRYRQSLDAKRAIGDRLGEARTLENIGNLQARQRNYDAANATLLESLRIKEAIGDVAGIGYAHLSLGSIALGTKDLESAGGHLLTAMWQATEAGQPDLLWRTLDASSRLYRARGLRDYGILYGKRAITTIQSLRGSLRESSAATRQLFLADKVGAYRNLADQLIDAGRVREAQQVMDLLQSETYSEFSNDADVPTPPVVSQVRESKIEEQYRVVSDRLAQLGNRHRTLTSKRSTGSLTAEEKAELDRIEAELTAARDAFVKYERQLEKEFESAGGAEAADFARMDLEGLNVFHDILKELKHGAVLIQYLVTDARTRVIVTGPDSAVAPVVRDAGISGVDLRSLVDRFRDVLRRPGGDPLPLAGELYAHLIRPIAGDLDALHASTLMLGLDDALRYVPFAALHDGNHYLVEQYPTSLYSIEIKDRIRLPPAARNEVAAFGVSHGFPGLVPLVAVPDEISKVIAQFPAGGTGTRAAVRMLDDKFTRDSLRSAAEAGYSVVHIASHFVLDPAGEERSYLLLGDGSHLTLAQWRRGDLTLPKVELLTLSACQTAIGVKDADGRELEGLATDALRSGSRAVVASLWSVADRSTAELMAQFYGLLGHRQATKAQALQAAQKAMLGDKAGAGKERGADGGRGAEDVSSPTESSRIFPGYTHPYYWAPFIMYGSWR